MGDGGKGGGGGFTAYNYYGTIAAVIRCGPVDSIRSLLVDGAEIWAGPVKRTYPGVTNPYTLTITDSNRVLSGGYVRLYWGDDDQTEADPALEGHPPYRGIAYMVFHKFLFGKERTTAPNIEVVCEACPRPPASIISSTELDDDGQANPFAILAELLTSIHGNALPATRLDAASWQAAHDYFALSTTRRAIAYCSPLLTSQIEGRSFASQIMSLCDGWLRMKSDGTIEAGYYPVDPGDLDLCTTLTAHDLTEPPKIEVGSWDSVPTGCVVEFSDGGRQYVQNSVKIDDQIAIQQAIEPRRDTLSLTDFVTREQQARRIAAEWVKRKCRPQMSGAIKVRPEKAMNLDGTPLRVGNRFLLDVEPEPGADTAQLQLCRVTERRRGATGPVELSWEAEIVQPAVPYAPAWTPPAAEDAEVAALASARVFPFPGTTSDSPAVAAIATRGDDLTVGARVLFDVEGGSGTFTELGLQVGFGVPVAVVSEYNDTATGTIRLELTSTRDQHIALTQPGPSGAQNDELLLVLWYPDGDYISEDANGVPAIEWFAIDSSVVVTGNTYDFTVLRARLGTLVQTWKVADTGFIIPRSSLVEHRHANFPAYVVNGDTLVFRMAPYSRFAEFGDIPADLPFRFPGAWRRTPSVVWTTPAAASYALPSNGELIPVATITDLDSNMNRIALYSTREDTGVQTQIFSVVFPQAGSKTLADCFTLAGASSTLTFADDTVDVYYTLTLRAEDASGNVVESRRSLVRLAEAGNGFLAPVITPAQMYFANSMAAAIDSAAPAMVIEYAVTGFGQPVPASTTQVTATHVALALNASARVWARAGDGEDWSAWVFADYRKLFI